MSTAIAPKQPAPIITIKDLFKHEGFQADIRKALPAHCKPDRMLQVGLNALRRNPKLANCTQASFVKCMIDCSSWGLEPDGRRAHLIPYGNECTLIIDWKGYAELAERAGIHLHAGMVYEGDYFDFDIDEVKSHVPWMFRRDKQRPKDRGELIAVYCQAKFAADGHKTAEYMTPDEIEAIRKRSKAANAGPWVTDKGEMQKKTVFRRIAKRLPLSAEIIDALEADGDSLDLPAIGSGNKMVQPATDLMGIIDAEPTNAEPSGDAGPGDSKPRSNGQNTSQDTPDGSFNEDSEPPPDPWDEIRDEFARLTSEKSIIELQLEKSKNMDPPAVGKLNQIVEEHLARVKKAKATRGERSNKQQTAFDTQASAQEGGV